MAHLSVGDEGLTTERGNVLPWDEVWHVEWTPDGAFVASRDGLLAVDRGTAQAIEQRIAPWELERDAAINELAPEQRAAWAELPAGEPWLLSQSFANRGLVGCMWLLAIGLGAGLALTGHIGAIIGGTLFFLMFAGVAVAVQKTSVGPRFLVDAAGIQTDGPWPRQYRWSDLRDAEDRTAASGGNHGASSCIVSTRAGRFVLRPGYSEGPRLREAIRRCLAFRREAVPVPEGKLGCYASSRPNRGLWLDDEGLAILRPGSAQRVAWGDLGKPEWTGQGPQLRAAGRLRRLWQYLGGSRLAREVDLRQAGNEPLVDADGELRADVIERWLGVAPGGAISCGLSPWVAVGCTGALLASLMLMAVLAVHGDHAGGNVGSFVVAVGMVAGMAKSASSVRADADGLSVRRRGRREYHAWSAVRSLSQTQYIWTIETDTGPVLISTQARNVGRVVGIVRRILAERELGAQLPGDAPLPETALSRIRGDEPTTTERGLSLSEPIHPQP